MTQGGKEKRRAARIERRVVIPLELDGKTEKGVLLNFSEYGLYVKLDRILEPGTLVSIPMRVDKNRVAALRGRIVWSVKLPPGTVGMSVGMGIELTAAPDEYIRFVETMRREMNVRSRGVETRFELYHRVRFQFGEAVLTASSENLSRGGMYLATDEKLKEESIICAELEIPGSHTPVMVEGRVAYCLDAKQAEKRGRAPGVGIQFVNLTRETKSRLSHYIRRLEIHRTRQERRQVGKLPESGTLVDYLVPEILLALLSESATGTLLLERRGVTKLIYIKDGQPIYVESNVRTETLGQFLFRQGKLSAADLEKSLQELSQSDMLHGEIMMHEGMIDANTLVTSLVEHQEEKLCNTFPWFDGKYEFVPGADWPPRMSMVPLRAYEVIFRGIERWYDANIIKAWLGLDEESGIRRLRLPPSESSIPPLVYRMLNRMPVPQTIRAISKRLEVPADRIFPAVFGLVIAGWVALDFSVTTETSQSIEPEKKEPPAAPSRELFKLVRRWIEEDYQRLQDVDFHELLGLGKEVSEAEITKAYLERSARYSSHDVGKIDDVEVRNKVLQILSWIRLAYDTLRDPYLRQIYTKRETKPAKGVERTNRIENERFLITCIRDLERGNYDKAIAGLTQSMEKNPTDPSIPGYLGWALFQSNQKKNCDRATELLDQSIERDPSEAQIHYYRGEIYSYRGNYDRAEHCFTQALRLRPGFVPASAARDLAKKKLRLSRKRVKPAART